MGSAQKTPSKTANGKSKTATITPSATATKPATIESMFGNQFAALAKEEEKQEALEEQKEKMEIAKKEAEEEAKKLRGGKKLSYAEEAASDDDEDEDADDDASFLSEKSIEELLDTSEEEEEEEEPSARKTRKSKKKLGKKTKKAKKEKKKTGMTTEGADGKKTKPRTEGELNDMSFDDLHDLVKGMLRTRGAANGDEPTAITATMIGRMRNQKRMILALLPAAFLDDLSEADVALPLGVLAAPAEENVGRLNLVVGNDHRQHFGGRNGGVVTAGATDTGLLFLGWRGGRRGGRRACRLIMVRFRSRSRRRWNWAGRQYRLFSRAR